MDMENEDDDLTTAYMLGLHDGKKQALSQSDLLDAAIEVERRLREDTKTIADLINRYGGKAEKDAWRRAIYGSAIRLQLFTSNNKIGGCEPSSKSNTGA